MKKIELPEESTKSDKIHSVVKGAVGAIPFVGGLTAESFGLVVSSPFQKRLYEWMTDVSERLNLLSDSLGEIDASAVIEEGRVLSAITRSTEIALRTHQDEKRTALIEAVASSALSRNDILEPLFFEFLDRFQPSHLKMLSRISVNHAKPEIERLETNEFLELFCDEELGGDRRLLYIHTEELEALRSLYRSDRSTPDREDGSKVRYLILTDLGADFLEFIGLH